MLRAKYRRRALRSRSAECNAPSGVKRGLDARLGCDAERAACQRLGARRSVPTPVAEGCRACRECRACGARWACWAVVEPAVGVVDGGIGFRTSGSVQVVSDCRVGEEGEVESGESVWLL